jgi:hypothetical protein
MDIRRWHHIWKIVRHIKPWYFLVIALVSGYICLVSLRANNQQMVRLRSGLYTADQNNGDIQSALNALQGYVVAHMNTDLSSGANAIYPPIQLKYTYERLAQARTEALSNTNSQLYNAAQAYCEGLNSQDFSGRNRVPCIESYVQSHAPSALPAIPDSLYKFAFLSPRWSPDMAGWSMLVAVLSALGFVKVLIFDLWLKKKNN